MNRTNIAQKAETSSLLAPAQGILQRKCACGNKTVAGGECVGCTKKKNSLQRKLSIGASNDPLEREADGVADQVMAMSSYSSIATAVPKIRRASANAEGADISSVPSSVDRVLASSGRSMESTLQKDMGQRFNYDFSNVRIHAGNSASQSARDINANAYTAGSNVVFGEGQHLPHTYSGKRLLAHELTHVVQQDSKSNVDMISREPDPSASSALPDKERSVLKAITAGRIRSSGGYFNTALLEVKIKVGNLLKEQKAAADAMLELAFGLLMPGLGKLLGKGLAVVAATLPTNASTQSYRVALKLLNKSRTEEIFVKATDTVLKVSKTSTNNKLKSITGDAEYESFFNALGTSAAIGFDELAIKQRDESLTTDEERGVLFMSYDPANAEPHHFVKVIEDLLSKFKEQVKPIGKKTDERYGNMKARWIEGSKWKSLALTGEGRYFHAGAGVKFITWISPQMKSLAIEATKAIRGGQVETVHYGTVQESSSATTLGMKLILDSDFPKAVGKKVLEPSSGTVRVPSKQVCPSCHGETSSLGSSKFTEFKFSEEDSLLRPLKAPAISESDLQAVQEWIQNISKDKK